MRYELKRNFAKGILIDRTPIMRDIKDTFEVSFALPENGAFVALFRGEDNIEHKAVIKNSTAKLPKELLNKEQYVGLIIAEVTAEAVVYAWECEPLKITAFLYLRQTQWQVSGGADDKDCYTRLAELETLYSQTLADFTALKVDSARKEINTAEAVASFRLELDVVSEIQKRLDTVTELAAKVAELTEKCAELEIQVAEVAEIVNDPLN